MTDVRKAVSATDPSYKKHSSRPSTSSRKITPQSAPKLGKNPRDREKELDDERWWDEERQSFPEYWYVVNNLRFVFHSFNCVFWPLSPTPLPLRPFPFPSLRIIT